jgi:polar amino acid transport system substrate-binding protein
MRKRLLWLAFPVFAVCSSTTAWVALVGVENRAHAQVCNSEYVIKENENLRDIARRVYGDPQQWSVIFYANTDRLGTNTTLLMPGQSIRIPCVGAKQGASPPAAPAPEAASTPAAVAPAGPVELSSLVRRIEFLTADDFEPFTGRSLQDGGMLTSVLDASMKLVKEQAKGRFDYGISWVNDWGAHLNPLLVSRAFDVGFPWTKPDCDNPAELDSESKYRCQRFFFSDPLAEILTVLFVKKDAVGTFAADENMFGKKLCQPAGSSAYDLDRGGRNWVKDGRIILMRPPSMEECFRWLDSNTVDAVVASELTGRAQLVALGMTDRIQPIDRPLAVGALHAIVTKTHPYARTILYYVNASIAQLRESGEYDRIVEEHLTRFWESQEKDPGTVAVSPAPTPTGVTSATTDAAKTGRASSDSNDRPKKK